ADIHSHYVDPSSESWGNYEFRGRVRVNSRNSGVGVTFLSDFPFSNRYYSLRRAGDSAFAVVAQGTQITGGVATSQVVPEPGVWYSFAVQVVDTGASTRISAKVWRSADVEPATWPIDCFDSSSTRLTRGTVGCWSKGEGQKSWAELSVGGGLLALPKEFLVSIESNKTELRVGESAEIVVVATYVDGVEDVTAQASFEISGTGSLDFSNGAPAVATATDEGTVSIRALYEGE